MYMYTIKIILANSYSYENIFPSISVQNSESMHFAMVVSWIFEVPSYIAPENNKVGKTWNHFF